MHANQLPVQIETLIVRDSGRGRPGGRRRSGSGWRPLYPDVQRPAISTVHAVLDRHYLVRYVPSPRPYASQPELDYPFHDKAVTVTARRRICLDSRKVNPEPSLRGPDCRHQGSRRGHLARLLHAIRSQIYRLGAGNVQTIDSPLGTRLSPMS